MATAPEYAPGPARDELIAGLLAAGWSMGRIGRLLGVSRQRVRQIAARLGDAPSPAAELAALNGRVTLALVELESFQARIFPSVERLELEAAIALLRGGRP